MRSHKSKIHQIYQMKKKKMAKETYCLIYAGLEEANDVLTFCSFALKTQAKRVDYFLSFLLLLLTRQLTKSAAVCYCLYRVWHLSKKRKNFFFAENWTFTSRYAKPFNFQHFCATISLFFVSIWTIKFRFVLFFIHRWWFVRQWAENDIETLRNTENDIRRNTSNPKWEGMTEMEE